MGSSMGEKDARKRDRGEEGGAGAGAKGEEEKKEEVEVQMPPPPARRRGGPTPAKRKNQIFLSVEAFISAWPEHQLSVMRKSPPALQLQESPALAAGEFPIWCGLCCRSVEAHKMHNAKYLVQHCSTNGHKNALAKAFQVLSGRSDAATIRGAMGGTPSDLSHDAPRAGRRRCAERGPAGCGKQSQFPASPKAFLEPEWVVSVFARPPLSCS